MTGAQRVQREQDDEREQDDDNESRGWYVGMCGHPVPISAAGYLGECECDNPERQGGNRG